MRDFDAYYVLDGDVVRKTTRDEAFDWLSTDETKKFIAQEDVGRFYVSTVFMIQDHGLTDSGPPVVFETMVFEREEDGNLNMTGVFTERCATLAEARAMHARTCERVRAGEIPESD